MDSDTAVRAVREHLQRGLEAHPQIINWDRAHELLVERCSYLRNAIELKGTLQLTDEPARRVAQVAAIAIKALMNLAETCPTPTVVVTPDPSASLN